MVPAVEAVAFDTGLWAYDRLRGEEWAEIDEHTIAENFRTGFLWDDDTYPTNFFLHPFHGGVIVAGTRSAGLGFWEAAPYVFGSSLLWEFVYERQAPSVSDQVVTPFGGLLVGEVMFRSSRRVLGPAPGPWRRLAAAPINPLGAVNELAWGSADPAPPFGARLLLGAGASGLGDPVLEPVPPAVRVAWMASEGPHGFARPLDHHDLWATFTTHTPRPSVTDPDDLTWDLLLRGVLVGAPVSDGRGLAGLWGLMTFTGPTSTRTAAQAVGPGAVWTLPTRLGEVSLTGVVGTGLGVGGATQPLVDRRDYAYAWVAYGLVDVALDGDRVDLRLRVDENVALLARDAGPEDVTLVHGLAAVRLVGRHGLAVTGEAGRRWAVEPEPVSGAWAGAGLGYVLWTGEGAPGR